MRIPAHPRGSSMVRDTSVEIQDPGDFGNNAETKRHPKLGAFLSSSKKISTSYC
jgi:hypothetical protein